MHIRLLSFGISEVWRHVQNWVKDMGSSADCDACSFWGTSVWHSEPLLCVCNSAWLTMATRSMVLGRRTISGWLGRLQDCKISSLLVVSDWNWADFNPGDFNPGKKQSFDHHPIYQVIPARIRIKRKYTHENTSWLHIRILDHFEYLPIHLQLQENSEWC